MIETGFENRVKIQQVIDSQLPEFILDESPKTSEFLKQYYISQEYQGGSVDIVENLDQYLKLDTLTPEVVVGSTTLSEDISDSSKIISVNSTKGFPQKYGLLKIDDEIITYTGLTTNTFIGCIRGFSGITNYHQDLNSEELVFSTSESSSHEQFSKVENLSSLFLQEFYKKIKYNLTPGLENLNFVSDLNVGNFIKESNTLYKSKGTNESFRILFNILFGETPKIIDLENYLLKPSSANYLRRNIVVAESISGNLENLSGQTIFKNNDPRTTASVSEVEIIQRKGKTYYKLFLFIGYDNSYPTLTGSFNITGSTKNINRVSIGSSIITVDSTIGFPSSGKIYAGNNIITYTDKSINQFFGCSGISSEIPVSSIIRSDEIYYGYENGDLSKKVEFRLTGVLSGYKSISEESISEVGGKIGVRNVGELIVNRVSNPSYKEIFANTWIYNTSSRYEIDSFNVGQISQFTLKSDIDKSSLKVGDYIDILSKDSNNIIVSNLLVTEINQKQVTTNTTFSLNSSFNYDVRRKIKTAASSFVPLEYNSLFSDIQNVYNENDQFMYVASNSLPSYIISKKIFSYDATGVSDKNLETNLYSIITFSSKVSFITGSEVYYKPSGSPIYGLTEGSYYVEVLPGNLEIRLYASRTVIGSPNYLNFGSLTSGIHNFTLNLQKEKVLSAQKILRKFPLTTNIQDSGDDLTTPGSIGMLINGVEIFSYKTNDKVYYGPLEKVNVLNGGNDFDVINPPSLSVSTGNALIQPVISGSVEKIYVTPQNFDIDVVVSVSISGGNGKGCSFEPVIERKRREIEFDARQLNLGGGVDVNFETITFNSNHGLIDGEIITYRPGNNPLLGTGVFLGNNFSTGQTLKSESTYYAKYISDTTIQLYPSYNDYVSGINTVGFTTVGTSGIQKFVTQPKNTLTEIKVLNGGSGYTNRKLRVSSSGVSTSNYTINFNNHGFNNGELVTYEYETSGISGLSTSNQYYVLKLDDNTFRLANAGIGGTYLSDYERGKYVKFQSSGSGYQIFNYPEINLSVEYTSVGIGSTQFRGNIEAQPVVKGKIIDVYVYESGVDYGSLILNNHKKPSIIIKNGKEAQIKPVIVNGRIIKTSIQYGGDEYYSLPNLKIIGQGTGASLKAVVANNKIVDVIIVNQGVGYSETDTTIIVEPSGKNSIFNPIVRSLTPNNNILFNDVNDTTFEANEIIVSSYNNLQYGICGYSGNTQNTFGESNDSHSPIIGWAYDGNPIYGSYGYSDPKNKNSPIKQLISGYTLNSANITNRPESFDEGFFIEDYQFTNSGDLDEYNGRFCITPEFPNGVYAYFATSSTDSNGNIVGVFPYFIGNKYKSKFISENKTLNQNFDFNSSKLIRNTFPYKVGDKYADNDFITESNEIVNQIINIDSVTSGSIENLEIVNSGDNYQVKDQIKFNETNTGGGLVAEVSEIKGKNILNLETKIDSYSNSIFIWESGETIKVSVPNNHKLENLNYVNLSGFSTELSSLNGSYQIGITSYKSTLLENLQNYSTTGIVTSISLTSIPENVSIGSSLKIDNEIFEILNIFKYENIIRVSRNTTGISHTATSPVYFIPNYFTIKKSSKYFDSKLNDLVYFNPKESIGIGTTSGAQISKTYRIGTKNNNISVPIQSIFIPNHPFQNGQQVIFTKPSTASNFSVSNTSGGSIFSFPESGNSQTVYVIKQSADHIGIVTQIGLTTTSNGLFFTSDGSDDYRYSIQSNFRQIFGTVDRIYSKITLDEQHNLLNGDKISLNVVPNLSVGIGTSTSVYLKYNSERKVLIVNPIGFSSTGINTSTSQIAIYNHSFKTGDKVLYQSTSPIIGLSTGFYFVYKVNNNNIKLCETLNDSISNPPLTVNISGVTTAYHELGLVNPEILSVKNNNLTFKLSDSSLIGYNLKIFYDNQFNNEFVSTGSTTTFSVSKIGTPGISSDASLVINYGEQIPNYLFYTLEKNGSIVSSDKEVKNYSKIDYIQSSYSGTYNISGIGSTTFDISLSKAPENNFYQQSNCNSLEYTTNSLNAYGGIQKIRIISSGSEFKNLPTFKTIETEFGTGAYIVANSTNIGKINQITLVNEGFEYSSDKTLNPEASIPSFLTIKNANTISSFNLLDGGKNYTSAPDLIIVNSETGEKISSGILLANLNGTSIGSISIDEEPKGLPDTPVRIISINNTNGIGIQNIQSSSSGIVTCILTTPLSGFGIEPFSIGDKIFVEGISKYGTEGDGFNSEDYGYQFFTVIDYLNSGTTSPRQIKFNLSKFTNNPGVASTIQNFVPRIINYKNYPKIDVNQKISDFIIGELVDVISGNEVFETDLKIVKTDKSFVKVSGRYDLNSNNIIRGKQSGSISTIENIKKSKGIFNIGYASTTNVGWIDDIGKLNDTFQVIPDNDYYQNLSYSVKSTKEWSDIVSPVNSILHTSGLKNFADTVLINNVSGFSSITKEYSTIIYDILEEKRIDTINNFDLVVDDTTQSNSSNILKFKNKKLSDYIECRTNRVLEIDDISLEFSNSNQQLEKNTKITSIVSSKKYEKYLIQVSNDDYSQLQFTELVVLVDDNDVFTLEKASLSNTEEIVSKIYGYNDDILNQKYLKLEPRDPNNFIYNIKYLNSSFGNFSSGIGTTSLGLINLTAKTSTISPSQTVNILGYSTSTTKSIYSEIHIVDNATNQMNYVEIFVDHDGTNTNMSEFYFDNSDDTFSSNFIGSFTSSINSGILNLSYNNISNNPVTIRTRTVGFGTTSIGIGTYRFKSIGQPSGSEKTVKFESSYSNVSVASTIFTFDYLMFSSIKSTIRVSTGQTSSLHQVMTVNDGNNTYTLQYPFLSIGSTSGIGTFGAEIGGGGIASFKFYPDQSISGNFEIVSFNQLFYKDYDYVNSPENLQYGNAIENVGVSKYFGTNTKELNKLSFELTHKGTPIFMKIFDPSDSSTLNPSTGEFNIPNHFFSTGEELIYRPNSTFDGVPAVSVGIGSTLNNVGIVTNVLPTTVYAIKIDNDRFKLSTRKEYALLTPAIAVTFTSYGSGNAHELEMYKKNEKSIISIDNMVQSPISYSLLNYTVNNGGQIGSATTTFALSGISSISIGDLLKIDNEYMKVNNIGFGTTYSGPISFSGQIPLVNVERGFVGSSATSHSNLSSVLLYQGSFNIVKNNINFTVPPQGGLTDQLFGDVDNLPDPRSYFNGRVFLKNNYDDNRVFDNISKSFTGIGQTYRLTVSGLNTVGIGSDGANAIVFINGIFQTPSTQNNTNNNFSIVENSLVGISTIIFTGITSSNGSTLITDYDVNQNQLPRGGLIVSLGSTNGVGYAPLLGASVIPEVLSGSIVSVGIGTSGNWGSGYRNPVSVAVSESGHTGTAASIVASVGAGGTLSFAVIDGGSGYNNPKIYVSSPNYENLPVTGVSRLGIGNTTETGIGLLLNVEVGAVSTTGIGSTLFEVTGFKITKNGYGFRKGDVIKPVGLITAYGLQNPISEFKLEVLDVFSDSFSAWQFGELDYIDSVKKYQDGKRTRFPLYYKSSLLSFEKNSSNADSQLIEFDSLLVIFINGVLQQPKVAYQFNGGTSFTFTDPPKVEDNISVFFYRGSSNDSQSIDVNESIKPGDSLQVISNNNYLGITTTQNLRTITSIPSSDRVETQPYYYQGIDPINFKPVEWIKQKVDKIIDGNIVSKSRKSIESQIYPTSKIIKNLNLNDSEVFVDNAEFFNYENEPVIDIEFDCLIIPGQENVVSAAVTAVVSTAGTIQSLVINNVGSGYTGSSVEVKISSPRKIGIGIGTIATATIAISNGSLTSPVTIINPGFGYTNTNPPQVIVPSPKVIYENVNNVTNIEGFSGNITGISTSVGIGTNLAIRFTLDPSLSPFTGLSIGYPIYIFDTKVGSGVTSIISNDQSIIGIGTRFLDNIYYISAFNPSVGIITCNVHSNSQISGILTSGNLVGRFSWGRLSGFTRSNNSISIGISGYTVNSGLTTYPTIQRRGYGFNNGGAIKNIL